MTAVDPTTYTFTENAFAKPRTYRLTEDALTWEQEGEPLDGVFYDDIAEVQMAYVPSRLVRNRYRTRIVFRQGGMVNLLNTDFTGFGSFTEKNREYTAFVRELHRRLAEKGKDVVYRKGSGTAAYVANVALTIFIFAMIAIAFLFLFNLGVVWIAVVKLAILLFFIPTLIRFIRRSRPGSYDPLAPAEDMLPDPANA
jgi:hypothetical protein